MPLRRSEACFKRCLAPLLRRVMEPKFKKPEEITSIELLEEEVNKVFLIKDKGVVRMVVSTIIANRLPLDPVWLLLVAPPSGGKTEMIDALGGLNFVYPISDLTVNTFASGMKRAGKETSLLMQMQNGVMAFKDFTSILSKNKDAKKEIMSQLREIFDGKYVKKTGTGEGVNWHGKLGAIAGCTEVIYRHMEEMSAMGDRFIMYNISQPDRLEVAERALNNANSIRNSREHTKNCFTFFVNHILSSMLNEEIHIAPEMKRELLEVADFATRVRSAVMTDFKSGLVDFVPTPEMPMRVTGQLYTLAAAFITINKANPRLRENHPSNSGQLTEEEKRLLFKTAFDSIPRTRRDVIIPLAEYRGGVSTAGLATRLGLPSESVRKYLYQVNALGICTRHKSTTPRQGDLWKMEEKHRQILKKVDSFEIKDSQLLGQDLEDGGGDEIDSLEEMFKSKYDEAEIVDNLDTIL